MAASARARPLPAARVSAASNSATALLHGRGRPPRHVRGRVHHRLIRCGAGPRTSASTDPSLVGSPIICCSKSDKSEEECVRRKSIINGKLNKMNHTGEEPPRRSNSSVQVERWVSSTLLATRTYEATIGSLGGPDANMPMRLRATNR
ncbi:uncharacterized protein LOC125549001 isoform X2 [Triticum urartu]|uniref:uncharacterized protein LOC125549001 isoform X2 n=1 Tax=Triticum urartu TaxID=4572 RepID=UPI002044C64E|nr:uncharacterized protein LOC125549001 isoform X2 [Triticum urartu]